MTDLENSLWEAISFGREDEVRELIAQGGVRLCAYPEKGNRTPLIEAARGGCGAATTMIIEMLIVAGSDLNACGDKSVSICTALLETVFKGNKSAAACLLKHGANPDIPSPKGLTPLMLAVSHDSLGMVKILVEGGADVNQCTDLAEPYMPGPSTALFEAIQGGECEIIEYLLAQGAGLEALNYRGVTPIIEAASKGGPWMVDILIKAGADVNARVLGGATPLMMAARDNMPRCPQIIRLLLKAGADVNVQADKGHSALHFAVNPESIKALVKAGAMVDALDQTLSTPLMTAVAMNRPISTVTALLESGADLNLRNNEGLTALDLAKVAAPDVRAVLEYWQLRPGAGSSSPTPRRQRL